MERLTGEFLIENGFLDHHRSQFNFRNEYTRYYDDVERSISFVSRSTIFDNTDDELFDVYFWGHNLDNGSEYATIDSHLSISTVEEFNVLMSMVRN
jgi:hypothetical protein